MKVDKDHFRRMYKVVNWDILNCTLLQLLLNLGKANHIIIGIVQIKTIAGETVANKLKAN